MEKDTVNFFSYSASIFSNRRGRLTGIIVGRGVALGPGVAVAVGVRVGTRVPDASGENCTAPNASRLMMFVATTVESRDSLNALSALIEHCHELFCAITTEPPNQNGYLHGRLDFGSSCATLSCSKFPVENVISKQLSDAPAQVFAINLLSLLGKPRSPLM